MGVGGHGQTGSDLRRIWGTLTPADRVLLAGLLCSGLVWAFWPRDKGEVAVIVGSGGLVAEVSMDQPDTLAVKGPLGTTYVVVGGGEAKIISSPCPQKLCVRSGPVRRPGEVVVCIPNRVAVTIKGRNGPDAVLR